MELPADLYRQIVRHCSEGDRLLDEERFDEALVAYRAAEQLIPDPKEAWEAATWVYSAIGDTLFYQCKYAEAWKAFAAAVESPDGLGNPFIHLRLGQCQYELRNPDKAADELARAYLGAAEDIFDGQDPKYFAFLSTRMIIE